MGRGAIALITPPPKYATGREVLYDFQLGITMSDCNALDLLE